jgi:hypothetical protein
MSDKDIIDWLQDRFTKFAEDNFGERPFTLDYIGNDGSPMYVEGADLRDCVRGAAVGEGRFRG